MPTSSTKCVNLEWHNNLVNYIDNILKNYQFFNIIHRVGEKNWVILGVEFGVHDRGGDHADLRDPGQGEGQDQVRRS